MDTTLLGQLAGEILESGRRVQNGKSTTDWSGADPVKGEQSCLFRKAFGIPIHN